MNGKIRNDKQVPRTERNCPICGKPAVSEHLPFCSRRCANIDLNRWLSGAYAIAGPPASDSNDKADD